MIQVPISTIEKPLTAIDYIAVLEECGTMREVSEYATACPEEIRQDERFARAVRRRIEAIRGFMFMGRR